MRTGNTRLLHARRSGSILSKCPMFFSKKLMVSPEPYNLQITHLSWCTFLSARTSLKHDLERKQIYAHISTHFQHSPQKWSFEPQKDGSQCLLRDCQISKN